MKIIVTDNYEEMSKKAADIVVSQLILKPDSILGFATGSTPLKMYKCIISAFKKGQIDFSKAITFNLDEYYGLNKENRQSYYYYMYENLFKHVNLDTSQIHIPNGMAEDIHKECLEYERSIDVRGGIDMQVLGIGRNGHIGFNEPDIEFEATTHVVMLDEQTIKDNSRFFNSVEDVPVKAISMGIKTIMNSKKIILLASGIEKAEAVYSAVCGNITPKLPASVLQLHQDVMFIIDKEAASKLNFEKNTGVEVKP